MKVVIYRNFKALEDEGEKEALMDRPIGKPKTCLEHEWRAITKLSEQPGEKRVKLAVVEEGRVKAEIEKIIKQEAKPEKAEPTKHTQK